MSFSPGTRAATARKNAQVEPLDAEARLEELTVQFRAVLDAIPDNVICQGPDHTVHWANRAAAGSSRLAEDLIGRKCHEIWHDRATPCASCPTEEALATGVAAERLSSTPDGRTWEIRAIPLRNGRGEVTTALKVARDVTARLERERERDQFVQALGEKNRELEDFAHTVAHDLKGPLVSLKGFVGLMSHRLAQGRTADLEEYLARLDDAGEQMARLIDGLLDLSSAGAAVGPVAAVSLAQVCEEAQGLLQGAFREQTVTCAIPPDLPPVQGDRTRLLQLFLNLLGNAAKFSADHPQPKITVEATIDQGHAVCAVSDNGIGLPPDQLDRIFLPFHKTDPRSDGSGLGLAIARRIVEAHGGRVWAESEGPGKGCRVLFSLPLA